MIGESTNIIINDLEDKPKPTDRLLSLESFMENPNPPSLNLSAPFVITFLLNLFLLLSPSSADTIPDNKYFINCGSRSDFVDGTNRTFVADRDYNGGEDQENKLNPSNKSASLALYQTARVSGKVFSYHPEIAGDGSYLVRLHFYPTTESQSAAVFSVFSDPKFLLLSNFTVRPNGTDLPVIREFLVSIAPGKFHIYFRPESSSVAYVNAIEVFRAFNGTDFTAFTDPPDIGIVTPAGRAATKFTGGQLRSQVLRTIHRINAGPQAIEAKDDDLWRKWVVDDPYLVNKSAAINFPFYDNDVTIERPEYTDKYIAPKMLYMTAKKLSSSTWMNISWSFGVRKNARHLVRAHFCDIVGLPTNLIGFDMYIYSHFGLGVDPYVSEMYVPNYIDFVVDSGDSGFVNISVAPDRATKNVNKTAFLNGLEILEFMTQDPNFVPPSDSNGTPAAVLVGSVGGGGLIVIVLILVLVWVSMRRRRRLIKASKLRPVGAGAGFWGAHSKGGSGNDDNPGLALSISIANLGLRIPLADILLATRDFDPSTMIGEGGFGKVYEGTLGNGVRVAVKRSNPEHGQGISEFRTEILVLSQFRHRHLVSLVGYCDDPPEMILVYEFIDNGTLRSHLYGDSSASPLSWKQRLEICIGSAKGIHYLHTSSEKAMIHRDIKSSNILLNQDCVAKVSDFGLSKSGAMDHDHVTTAVKGTIGYLDPEYFKWFQLTEKSDVYSFGVVLLEVLCARKPINDKHSREETTNLAEWAMSMHQRGKLKDTVDASIEDEVDSNSLRKFGETVAKCLREHGSERPYMKDVLWDLNYALQLHESAVRKGGAVGDEDSSTGALLGLSQFSWDGCEEEDEDAEDDCSTATASHPSNVFSQIKFHDGR